MRIATWPLVFLLFVSSTAHAQSGWDTVQALSPGIRLRIRIQDRGREHQIEGRLESTGHAEITVVAHGKAVPLSRESIRQIAGETGRRLVTQKARNGLLVGAIAGAVVAAIAPSRRRIILVLWTAASWGAVGALIGATDGLGDREYEVVYRRPSPQP